MAFVSRSERRLVRKIEPIPQVGMNAEAMPVGISRLERMAAGAALVSMPRQAMLGRLLEATLTTTPDACVLRPLWVEEAMQRAYNIIRLTVELERQAPLDRDQPVGPVTECRIVAELAELFRCIGVADDEMMLPCSEALRTTARLLVELFGPTVGKVVICTSIERLAMPGFKRRALVLTVSELVINALRHGFAGRTAGRVTVALGRVGPRLARLSVADDGCGVRDMTYGGIAYDLAKLLEADIVYHTMEGRGTVVEIEFPAA